MPFLKKRRARRSSKRASKARRPVLSPPERAKALHCAFRNPRGRTASSARHAAGSRFFLRIAPPRPPQLETRLKGAPTCPFAARTRRSIALRLPQSARQDGFLRPSRRWFPVLSAHRAAAPAAARNAPQKHADTCPFAARVRRSMHCAFRNPRGRTASSVRHAAGSRFFLRIAPPHPPQLETRLKGVPTCPFAARTLQSMHCAFRNPRGRTAPSVRHAAGSRSRPRSHV